MRQDLKLADEAEKAGWEVEKSSVGKPYNFTKGNVHVWACIHKDAYMWAKAVIINNMYTGHTYHTDLAVQLGLI